MKTTWGRIFRNGAFRKGTVSTPNGPEAGKRTLSAANGLPSRRNGIPGGSVLTRASSITTAGFDGAPGHDTDQVGAVIRLCVQIRVEALFRDPDGSERRGGEVRGRLSGQWCELAQIAAYHLAALPHRAQQREGLIPAQAAGYRGAREWAKFPVKSVDIKTDINFIR